MTVSELREKLQALEADGKGQTMVTRGSGTDIPGEDRLVQARDVYVTEAHIQGKFVSVVEIE